MKKMYFVEPEHKKAALEAYNNIVIFRNSVAFSVQTILRDANFKSDWQLYKKDADKAREVLTAAAKDVKIHQSFIESSSSGFIYLRIRATYKNGPHTIQYIDYKETLAWPIYDGTGRKLEYPVLGFKSMLSEAVLDSMIENYKAAFQSYTEAEHKVAALAFSLKDFQR